MNRLSFDKINQVVGTTAATCTSITRMDSVALVDNTNQEKPLSALSYRSQSSTGKRDSAVIAEGLYLPPAKRRLLQESEARAPIDERATVEVQKKTWEEQKRVVHGTINRLNTSTIKPLIHDLFDQVNIIRLRGVLTKSLLAAAISSLQYSQVYAAMVAVINTKLPEFGELMIKRAVLAFRRHYKRKEKQQLIAVVTFLGHLFHQSVVHELMLLQILTLLLDESTMTDDSVEVAIRLLTLVGQALLDSSPASLRAVLDRLRTLLHEGTLDKRVEYKLEKLLELRKSGFSTSHPAIPPELDLVELEDQITLDDISLDDDAIDIEAELDVFNLDPDYLQNEEQWSKIRAEVLGLSGDSDSDDSDTADDNATTEGSSDEGDQNPNDAQIVTVKEKATQIIQDLTEADLVHLRRTIYLTIMSSATFEECAHKLAKIEIPEGREEELINMLIECCSQERTFLRYYGLIAARFCFLSRNRWRDAFMDAFSRQYSTIHRLETNKLRNVAKLFAHVLHTDSMPWSVFSVIHLNEDQTTSSSRIFIKILLQEIAEAIGIMKLKQRFESSDVEELEWYKGLFPKDSARNTRYAINFFTSIGLGPLTDELREHLKNAPKLIIAQAQQAALVQRKERSDDDGSSSSVSSTSSSSSSDSSSGGSSSVSTSSKSYSSRSSVSSASSYSHRRRSRNRGSSKNRGQRGNKSPTLSRSSTSSRSYSSRSSTPKGKRKVARSTRK
jgi:pre-mRNA-splicing factor CWC22